MLPCLALSITEYESRVKWSNPGNEVAPTPTPRCRSYSKKEPSDHPQLRLPTFLFINSYFWLQL